MKNSFGVVKRYNVHTAFGYTIFRTFRMEQIFVERLEFFLNLLRKSEREWSLAKRTETILYTQLLLDKAWFPHDRQDRPDRAMASRLK